MHSNLRHHKAHHPRRIRARYHSHLRKIHALRVKRFHNPLHLQ